VYQGGTFLGDLRCSMEAFGFETGESFTGYSLQDTGRAHDTGREAGRES